ncbi:MAG: cysteine synthase A [Senegalia sp. (in: firmicutes)]
MKVVNNIIELIGETPMIKLNKIVDSDSADVLVKLESFNPGGSIKDRIALNMIEEAEKEGLLKEGSTIIEATSGNTGIGLAMIGAAKGYKVILVMPDTMSMERRTLLRAYGAELVLTMGEKGMNGAIEKANSLKSENDNYFMPEQFKNNNNPQMHKKTTAKEILEQTDGNIDAFVAGVGTGGTITGVGSVLKEINKDIRIIAVEPSESAVMSGEDPGTHRIQGIGAGFIPHVLDMDFIDEIKKVSGEDAVKTTRELAKKEGIFVGISSGAAINVALKVAKELGKGKRLVVIAPDSGERYLSMNIFN